MRPDGSDIEQLTRDDRVNWFPHISPDGARHFSLPTPVVRRDTQQTCPYRGALLELHAALTGGSPLDYTLADLADGLETAAAIGSPSKETIPS
jgi:hypothetical protein